MDLGPAVREMEAGDCCMIAMGSEVLYQSSIAGCVCFLLIGVRVWSC